MLDVKPSDESGLDIARELRDRSEAKGVRIALYTGLDEDTIRREFSDYDLFLPKADDANVLLTMIASVLSKQGEAPPAS